MAKDKQRVVVLGGGFGGIKAALELTKHDNFYITLISNHPDFRYYPSLYHTATGGNRAASSIPLAEIFAKKNVKVVIDPARKLDRTSKKIETKTGKKYSYDHLIIALGVVTNYFGIKGLDKYSFGIKTNAEAQELRDHLHKLIYDDDKPELNYVVIGGGPTGVELAGALPGYLRHIMKKHGVPPKKFRVDLVEALPRLMPKMSRHYSHAVLKRLRRLGVTVYLNTKVEAETASDLIVSGRDIKSHTVVWTAGVTNHPFFTANKFNISAHGKVAVNEILAAEPDIYVIGDNADTKYSGMAQNALHDGIFVAKNLVRASQDKALASYKARRPIYITPAGPWWAAVSWGKVEIYGLLGWLLRSAADFMGYRDLEPWWKASEHWLKENQNIDVCPICAGKNG